jgi:hypothetical protein
VAIEGAETSLFAGRMSRNHSLGVSSIPKAQDTNFTIAGRPAKRSLQPAKM